MSRRHYSQSDIDWFEREVGGAMPQVPHPIDAGEIFTAVFPDGSSIACIRHEDHLAVVTNWICQAQTNDAIAEGYMRRYDSLRRGSIAIAFVALLFAGLWIAQVLG